MVVIVVIIIITVVLNYVDMFLSHALLSLLVGYGKIKVIFA